MLLPYQGFTPQLGEQVFVAPNVAITGDVQIGDHSSIWFGAVIRGDVSPIRIGRQTNIQDSAILHATFQKSELHIGDRVTVGHRAILHGCTVEDACLIGMGAIILDRATVGKHALIAAGAVVLEGSEIPSGSLAAGIPAVVKRALTPAEIAQIEDSAERYVDYSRSYADFSKQ